MRRILLAAPLLVASLLAGCAGNPASGSAEQKETVERGIVEAVTPIQLDASTSAGAQAGSIFGGVGGASSGGGSGAAVGSIFGAVLGGTMGREAGIATKPGLEIWVKLDDTGKSAYVMQPGMPDDFKVGDPVRVIRKGGKARVEPMPAEHAPPETAPKSELSPKENSVH